jgi:molybdate transport system substrate-binding protein
MDRRITLRARMVCAAAVCALLTMASAAAAATSITVAAAADLGPALREMAAQFEKRTGTHINIVLGSSGNLATQIENGAPYDVFMSADVNYARQLESSGHAVAGTLYRYARGRLVLWALNDSGVDVARGWQALRDARVHKIAIANPQHAPYGRAARDALTSAGLYEELAPRLVLGENVAQAAQFVMSGNAQAGLLPLALALSPEMRAKGKYWEVPQAAYPPIDQAAVVVRGTQPTTEAMAFLAFLKTADATAVLRRYGFDVNTGTAAAKDAKER